ncbi:hypothetical protein, unknown function [Leishmania mexicana MHOM/GT/2001/U1103]|uniref:Uncharacterized protein n=1 Tax=Leishmania mexicana (strain MHOM/GT/2001/U1103) TaxID=929439 RepID=E9AX05_LEIMU|nr:hypothetical protein, unknown function [Leishmania mexicana MHOM/GT/2001/U1103]CBZ27491.1 hypothetical protein, unknown function [Leishmania mexicana MHOM/GT/2001/U1103]
MSRSQQINDNIAEAMRRADNAAAECPTEESHSESGATLQQQQNEAAAEAMRRADVAYTMDDDI